MTATRLNATLRDYPSYYASPLQARAISNRNAAEAHKLIPVNPTKCTLQEIA